MVRATRPTVSAAHRRRPDRRLGHRALGPMAAGTGTWRAPSACRVEHRPAVWIALGAVTFWLAPGAAYLWLLPLLSAGLLLSIIPTANAFAVRAASAVVFVITAALWLQHREVAALFHGRDVRATADRHAGIRLRSGHDRGRPDARTAARRDHRQVAPLRAAVARDRSVPLCCRCRPPDSPMARPATRRSNRFDGRRAPSRRAMDRRSGTWDRSSPASISPKALRRGGCRRQPRRTPPCHFDACPIRSFFDRTDPPSVRRRSPSPPRRSSRSKRAPSCR